jgi:hypothetical protein
VSECAEAHERRDCCMCGTSVVGVEPLVNLRWCVLQLRNAGHFEVATALLNGDAAGFRRELHAAARAAEMRVQTRLTDRGMFAWDPDHNIDDRLRERIEALESVPEDDFGGLEQPRCVNCGVLMRDVPGGWDCPACDHAEFPPLNRKLRPEFDGPSIRGG